jgi:hypothetical protein
MRRFLVTKPGAVSGHVPGGSPVWLPSPRPCYLSESVNLAHASAGTLSVQPSRSTVSLTKITPAPLAISTQLPPDVPE